MLIISYPLFQSGKVGIFVLISLVYPLFQAGKIWHYVLIMVILCFRQGRLALRANNKLSSVSGREDLALRANNWLSSVSGREG